MNRRFRVCAHIALHARKIPFHCLKKSTPLWLVMIDVSAPMHEKRKLVISYKNVLPRKRTVVAEVCEERDLLQKIMKKWRSKTATDVNNNPTN